MLSEYLKRKNIIIGSTQKNRWDMINEMLDMAEKNKEISTENFASIQEALLEREKSMSTGIGKGVAIPHCTSEKVNEIVIVLSVSQNGVNFDAIDNLPVNIAIMLIVPKSKLTQHIKTLANVAKLMSNEILKEKILSYKTPDSILKIIKEQEEGTCN